MGKREFRLADEHTYDRRSALRWLGSHMLRYPLLPIGLVLLMVGSNALMSYSQVLIGSAFRWVAGANPLLSDLLRIALTIALVRFAQGLLGLGSNACSEYLAQRLERDTRDELYVSLLGKSLTFHGQQRVGDLMARATNDVRQLNFLVSPGMSLITDSLAGIVVPLITIATIRAELLVVPILFVILLVLTLIDYTRRLSPVSDAMRNKFGDMNAVLEETVSGIEVVKVNAQEIQEETKFVNQARAFRDSFVEQGEIQAKYWPFLIFSFAYAGALLHALLLYIRGESFGVADIIAFMGVFGLLRFPTFLSLFTFTLVQMGISGADRILGILNTDTELDENAAGVSREMAGEVVFEGVSFGYGASAPVLRDISFTAAPGETIAIVGATGSGKTTLTRLINRVYDVRRGRVTVDGIDVRDWNLESLRGQIGTIEQDVFLFSRSLAENIAFGVGQQAEQHEIERCAKEAQAHDFITSFPQGYDTEVGERGVTLSGGQRQRIAIARAFLANPRILVLDDSTSAIDSATEDDIQRAMYRVQQGRTTFLITHRLSQIRWADRVLVLQRGELVDQGSHEELMQRCSPYQRIFASRESEPLVPPKRGVAGRHLS